MIKKMEDTKLNSKIQNTKEIMYPKLPTHPYNTARIINRGIRIVLIQTQIIKKMRGLPI